MSDEIEFPPGIGPHEGRELELMLKGEKPLALFSDVVPSSYEFPDAAFEPHVASGKLVKREFLEFDGLYNVRTVYFALPHEAWRIDAAHALDGTKYRSMGISAAEACARLGRLLGYGEDDIRTFTRWSVQFCAQIEQE